MKPEVGDILIIDDYLKNVVKVTKEGVVVRGKSNIGIAYNQTLSWNMLNKLDVKLITKEEHPEYFL